MANLPTSYDEWLALSDDERDIIWRDHWSAYRRDGIAFPYMAATRLAMQSPYKVLNIAIGTFHCGEYLLHLTVSEADFANCPRPREQSFEGFRVVWFPPWQYAANADARSSIEGNWIAVESSRDLEFSIRLTDSGAAVTGVCRQTKCELLIDNPVVNRDYILFTAYHPLLMESSNHIFHLLRADRCEDSVTRTEYYVRTGS